jgi:hypothetical protein
MNKAQLKAKKARVLHSKMIQRMSIAGRFHNNEKIPTLDEYFNTLRRIGAIK